MDMLVVVPAAVSMLVKLIVLGLLFNKRARSRVFNTMIWIFACHNICEIFALTHAFTNENATHVVRFYYAFSFWGMIYILLYALEVSKSAWFKTMWVALPIFAGFASLISLFTDQIVSGSTVIDGILISSKGSLYWIFQSTVLISMFTTVGLLIVGSLRASGYATRTQCVFALIAIAPLTLVGPTIIFLQSYGVIINTSMLLPICSTLYLVIVFIGESRHGLTDIRMYLPKSIERQTSQKLLELCAKFSNSEYSLRETQDLVERTLIMHALQKTNYNMSQSAEQMQVNRSTLYSACKRLGIELSERPQPKQVAERVRVRVKN